MRHPRRTVWGAIGTGLVMLAGSVLTGCGAPAYTYVTDKADNAYFKVPASWRQVNPQFVTQAQSLLTTSLAGKAGGTLEWSRAYAETTSPSGESLLDASDNPVVYASVQNMKLSLRGELSFNVMRDLIFPVTQNARQEAAAAGETLAGFQSIGYTLISNKFNMRGINEVFEYEVDGQSDAFDLTVMTNAATTKLYLLLIQCYQECFAAHESQIAQVANSFTVRGS
jgi:hypothetical protein